jgi:hypothetical protein
VLVFRFRFLTARDGSKKYTCTKFQYTHNIPRREWHRPDDPSADHVGFAIMLIIALDLMQIYTYSIGDLDKINPNLKRFQIINHRRNNFKKITPFCIAIHGGNAEGGATPGGVARR